MTKPHEWQDQARPFVELTDSGLLWLINRVVFHPRGFALALVIRDGVAVGWNLLGDGSEVWRFEGNEDHSFDQVMETFRQHARPGGDVT